MAKVGLVTQTLGEEKDLAISRLHYFTSVRLVSQNCIEIVERHERLEIHKPRKNRSYIQEQEGKRK